MAFPTDAQLKSELQTDPTALGYAPLIASGQVQALADKLNLISVANQVPRPSIPTYEIHEAMTIANFGSCTTDQKQWLQTLFTVGSARMLRDDGVTATNVRSNLLTCFGAGTPTRNNLALIEKRAGSRAELLWGPDISITAVDVQRALAS